MIIQITSIGISYPIYKPKTYYDFKRYMYAYIHIKWIQTSKKEIWLWDKILCMLKLGQGNTCYVSWMLVPSQKSLVKLETVKMKWKITVEILPSTLHKSNNHFKGLPAPYPLLFLQTCTQAPFVINRKDCPFGEERPYLETILFHHNWLLLDCILLVIQTD